jgi:hypothetical protein
MTPGTTVVGSAATESVAASDLGSEMMEADCRIGTVRSPTLVVKDGSGWKKVYA